MYQLNELRFILKKMIQYTVFIICKGNVILNANRRRGWHSWSLVMHTQSNALYVALNYLQAADEGEGL